MYIIILVEGTINDADRQDSFSYQRRHSTLTVIIDEVRISKGIARLDSQHSHHQHAATVSCRQSLPGIIYR